ncbi:MAG: hypothetical protein QM749_17530 [Aquabacterium sp.]
MKKANATILVAFMLGACNKATPLPVEGGIKITKGFCGRAALIRHIAEDLPSALKIASDEENKTLCEASHAPPCHIDTVELKFEGQTQTKFLGLMLIDSRGTMPGSLHLAVSSNGDLYGISACPD